MGFRNRLKIIEQLVREIHDTVSWLRAQVPAKQATDFNKFDAMGSKPAEEELRSIYAGSISAGDGKPAALYPWQVFHARNAETGQFRYYYSDHKIVTHGPFGTDAEADIRMRLYRYNLEHGNLFKHIIQEDGTISPPYPVLLEKRIIANNVEELDLALEPYRALTYKDNG